MAKTAAQVEIKVSQDGSRLVTGDNLTLYYFMPQRYDPNHEGPGGKNSNGIPWMGDFPSYMKDWIEDWKPLTGSAKIAYKGNNRFGLDPKDFSTLKRGGSPFKGKQQIMFRTWYLYLYKGDNPNQINGEVNGIWQKVSPDLIDLRAYLNNEPPPPSGQQFTGGP